MRRIRTSMAAVMILLCQLYLAGCASGSAELAADTTTEQATVSTATEASTTVESEPAWSITVVDSQIVEAFSGTENSMQYNGENISTEIQETPGEGNEFLLMEMEIEKVQAGASAFSWDQLYVEDGSGNQYQRCANDSFLENYGYARIKSTDLTLGTYEGYICFEVPAGTDVGTLTLHYESDEETLSIPLG